MPKSRTMSLTADLVARCYRVEPELAFENGWTRLSDADYASASRRLAESCAEDDLWVFAYGSLIWKTEFETVEQRRATAYGWHRSFCLEMETWRGSPEQMGLMMALDRGGRCDGVVYKLPKGDHAGQIGRLLRRETWHHESVAFVRWLPTRTEQGTVQALGFWVGPSGDGISPGLPLAHVAGVLARACGYAGSCAGYLYNTVSHLEEFGIHDRNLWILQHLVAEEIERIYPQPALTSA